MMFGLTIIRKSTLKKYEKNQIALYKVNECYRWFSGWRDLDIIWDHILKDSMFNISTVRDNYANSRGTDCYGKIIDSEKQTK